MRAENEGDIRDVWQSQPAGVQYLSGEMRTKLLESERRMRRSQIDGLIAFVLSAIAIIFIAALFAQPLLIAGAVLLVGGLAVVAYEVVQHGRHKPAGENGTLPSLDYQKALLEHRLEFHQKRLWLRVLSLAPGGVLFFIGFATARPNLAPFIYVQLATFIIAIALILPMNRRAAGRLQRQIAELETLR